MEKRKISDLLLPWVNLGLDESVAGQLCPFCDGGEAHEKSFSVTKKSDGTIVYFCHRAKCNRAGAMFPDGTHPINVHTKTKYHKTFDEPTEALTKSQIKFFEAKYSLTEKEVLNAGFLWAPERHAVWQPIRAPDGHYRGCVLRRYKDKAVWTYKAHEESREPLLAWYKGPKGFDDNSVVLVEDILSALKLSRYWNACAINSTHLSPEAVLELIQWSGKQYIALDKDAILTAIKQARRWRGLLHMEVIECNRDPKYWTDEQLQRLTEKD